MTDQPEHDGADWLVIHAQLEQSAALIRTAIAALGDDQNDVRWTLRTALASILCAADQLPDVMEGDPDA